MSDVPEWLSAVQGLESLQRAAQVLALLQALQGAGLTESLADGAPVTALLERVEVPARRLEAVLGVLASHGVVREHEGGWRLRQDWASLVHGESPVSWQPGLEAGRVQGEAFAAALTGARDYWSLPPGDRLVLAQAMSFDPSTDAGVEMIRRNVAAVPGQTAALEAGGRFLELGCGIASRLTALLRAFPEATAVGVELTEDLAEFGYERARRLGVADRLEIAVVDATEYEPEGLFDGAQWSQFFFPESARLGTLATARMALRPGAWLTAPVLWDGLPHPPGSEDDRELAHTRLLLDLWDVPTRTTGEVAQELETAGFVNVSVEELPEIHRVRGCQP